MDPWHSICVLRSPGRGCFRAIMVRKSKGPKAIALGNKDWIASTSLGAMQGVRIDPIKERLKVSTRGSKPDQKTSAPSATQDAGLDAIKDKLRRRVRDDISITTLKPDESKSLDPHTLREKILKKLRNRSAIGFK